MNGDGLSDMGEDLDLEELLGWDGEDGPTWRIWLLAGAGVVAILALAVIRRRAIARMAVTTTARATHLAEPGKLELGRGQWAHLGMVFDPVEPHANVAEPPQ